MGREEQIEEREVLDSIFPDEIQDISEVSFRISILLDVVNESGDETPPPRILFQVAFTDSYPDEAPILDIFSAPSEPIHPYLDVGEDKAQLLEGLAQTIEENLGMQMIFSLQSTLKENAESLISERQAASRLVEEKRIMALEAEENKKFHGTPVNTETFPQWRNDFRKEMVEKKFEEEQAEDAAELKRNRGKEKVIGLTGRQLWERGMAGKFEEEGDDGAPIAEMQKIKV